MNGNQTVDKSTNEIKSLTEIPQTIGQPAKSVPIRERISIYDPRRKEPVVNSPDIQWKPIDNTAAFVVSKALWYNKPPRPEPEFMEPIKPRGETLRPEVRTKKILNEKGVSETVINMEDVAVVSIDNNAKTVKNDFKASDQLIEKAMDTIGAMEYLTNAINGPWKEYQEFVKTGLAETREQRIALGSETRILMAALGDVRKFFLDPNHVTEVARLKEFVELCERLKALKECGFLDTVADTILKLQGE